MATYSSPFKTNLQTNLFTEDNVGHLGLVDCLGEPSSVYAMVVKNADAGIRYFAMWDSTTVAWDSQSMLLRIPASTDVVVHVDNGASFLTAVSISASTSTNPGALVSPTNLDLTMFATPPS